MSAPEHMMQQLDAALAEYTPGIDRAVRFVTIDQVDMLAEFYLHNRASQPDPRDEVIARLVEPLTVAANRLDRCAVDYETGSYEFIETCEWVDEARAALAAAKAVQP